MDEYAWYFSDLPPKQWNIRQIGEGGLCYRSSVTHNIGGWQGKNEPGTGLFETCCSLYVRTISKADQREVWILSSRLRWQIKKENDELTFRGTFKKT